MLWNCFLIFIHTYTFLWSYSYQNVLRFQKHFCLITWYKIVSYHMVQNCIIWYDTLLFYLKRYNIYDTITCYITQHQHYTISYHSIILYHNTCYNDISFYIYDTILIKLHDTIFYVITLNNIVSHCMIQYCTILNITILYHITWFNIMITSYKIIYFATISFMSYTLYYTILYCMILYHITQYFS